MGNVSRGGILWYKKGCCKFLKWCQKLPDAAEVEWFWALRDAGSNVTIRAAFT